MIRDSGMPPHEEIIGTLLETQLGFWKVLDLINHVAGNYNPFVGMVKDSIWLAGILSSSLVSRSVLQLWKKAPQDLPILTPAPKPHDSHHARSVQRVEH